MANKGNLKPFTSENQPPGEKKSRKGIPNRATVFKRLMKMKTEVDDPTKPGEKLIVPLYEAAALGQLLAAAKGNHNAWKEIQDSLHGKQAQPITGEGGGPVQHTMTVVLDFSGKKDGDS